MGNEFWTNPTKARSALPNKNTTTHPGGAITLARTPDLRCEVSTDTLVPLWSILRDFVQQQQKKDNFLTNAARKKSAQSKRIIRPPFFHDPNQKRRARTKMHLSRI